MTTESALEQQPRDVPAERPGAIWRIAGPVVVARGL